MDRLLRDYGMIFVLLGLCIVFSVLTLEKQTPDSNRVADQILEAVGKQNDRKTHVLTVGSSNKSILGSFISAIANSRSFC